LVKPMHPIEGLPLQRLNRLPGAFLAHHLGLLETVDGLGKCVVVTVSGAAYRGIDLSLQEPLAVADRNVLRAPVAVVYQPAFVELAGVERLLQGIQHKVRLHVAANSPANDEPREHINDKGHISKALPGRDKGEVSHPELFEQSARNAADSSTGA